MTLFQMVCGDLNHINQSTVCRLIKEVSRLLASKLSTFVKFPKNLSPTKRGFFEMARFPGVIGCIDCTHVPIKNPGGQTGEDFRNRKGWFSVNVQVLANICNLIHRLNTLI